jgi:hypothetical protein
MAAPSLDPKDLTERTGVEVQLLNLRYVQQTAKTR